MRARIVSFVFLILAASLIFMVPTSSNEPAQAVDVVNCTSIRVDTSHIEIKCTAAGIIVLDTTVNLPPGPTVEVTLPQATATVRVPGPTKTATVRVPVPGPTQSVTVTAPVVTETVKGPTSTVTITASPTRQVDNGSGTVEPSPSASSGPEVITLPGPTTVKGAALGTLAILILAGLILLALFSGYTLGYKEADVDNATFMKRILKKE